MASVNRALNAKFALPSFVKITNYFIGDLNEFSGAPLFELPCFYLFKKKYIIVVLG
jgi:hypothetical protein